jgi:hypothetical protein
VNELLLFATDIHFKLLYIDYLYLPFPLGIGEYSAAFDMVTTDET